MNDFERVSRAADIAAASVTALDYGDYVDDTLDQQLDHFLTLADKRDVAEINRLAAQS